MTDSAEGISRRQVTGVLKREDGTISHICGADWKMTVEEAIWLHRSNMRRFYVAMDGQKVDVVPVENPGGRDYLSTVPDDTKINNLHKLPPCASG